QPTGSPSVFGDTGGLPMSTGMPKAPDLTYAIEVWSDDGRRVEEVLGRLSLDLAAIAAFDAACYALPGKHLALRQGTRVLRTRHRQRRRLVRRQWSPAMHNWMGDLQVHPDEIHPAADPGMRDRI